MGRARNPMPWLIVFIASIHVHSVPLPPGLPSPGPFMTGLRKV